MADTTRIRVVFDGHVLTPHRSGIGEYARQLLPAMLRCCADQVALHLYTPSGIVPVRTEDEIETLARDVREGDFFRLHHQWRLPRLLRQGHYDVYHSPDFLIPFRSSIPVVSTIHDLIPLAHPEFLRKSMKVRLLPLYRLAVQTAVRRSARVLTVSAYSKADIVRRLSAPAEKVDVVHVAAGLTPPADAPVALPHAALEDGRFLLYVSRHDPYKGLGLLLRAFARLLAEGSEPNLRLAVAGKRDARYPYDALVQELALHDRVLFLDYVSRDQLSALYARALGLVFPSLYEGFGLPLLDAMEHGTPVLSSNRASLPEVGGEAAQYFDPENHEEFVRALKTFVESGSLRQTLIEKGNGRVRQFSWDQTAQATVESYRRAVRK
ncbi:MAG: hypothetical protein C0600_15260 [Ignavibacteria bacterium]|nr:MAG: hypothetical protein C0600_15260 [Ignavibacteria bacterium]